MRRHERQSQREGLDGVNTRHSSKLRGVLTARRSWLWRYESRSWTPVTASCQRVRSTPPWSCAQAGLTVWRAVADHQVRFSPSQGIQDQRNRRWQRDIRLQRRHVLQRRLQCQRRDRQLSPKWIRTIGCKSSDTTFAVPFCSLSLLRVSPPRKDLAAVMLLPAP